jgi:hypothetical protein
MIAAVRPTTTSKINKTVPEHQRDSAEHRPQDHMSNGDHDVHGVFAK